MAGWISSWLEVGGRMAFRLVGGFQSELGDIYGCGLKPMFRHRLVFIGRK